VHVDDVVSVLINSIEKGKGIYVIAGDPLTQKEIFDIAAHELNVPAPLKKMNYTIAYWYSYLRNKLGKKGFTTEHISILGSNRVFECSKAKNELAFKPRPLVDGIKAMVQYLKAL
jgi:nucleoside-diphosphate-sugar epimerase